MLGVFAVWALSGFGYPSAPVPLTLNIVSKLLAFGAGPDPLLPPAALATANAPASPSGPRDGKHPYRAAASERRKDLT